MYNSYFLRVSVLLWTFENFFNLNRVLGWIAIVDFMASFLMSKPLVDLPLGMFGRIVIGV